MTSPSRNRFRLSAFGWATLVLSVWIAWLRAPTVGATLWNVDESIHAAIARVLMDGGVLYRDAIDQRTPLTYYLLAGLFSVTGISLAAARILLIVTLVATAGLLGDLARRLHGLGTGIAAAFAFAAFSTWFLDPGDMFAIHTEWFVILFTVAAARVFWHAGNSGLLSARRAAATGALIGLATLSKQVALLELAPPLITLVVLGSTGSMRPRAAIQAMVSLLIGFIAVVGAAIVLLVAAGAGPDFLFYAWTYNIRFYGPEISLETKLLSPLPWFDALARTYPLLLATGLIGGVAAAVRTTQFRASPVLAKLRGAEVYLLTWCGVSLGEAIAGGRGFHHYFFVCLPPFAWAASFIPGLAFNHWGNFKRLGAAAQLGLVILTLGFIATVTLPPLQAHSVKRFDPDPALRVSAFVAKNSAPSEKIFVWGFNPDIYLYANRPPASRFVYCSFLTGLIPWTNVAPGVDTAYAIVPGAMDQLLSDLTQAHPKFIVDCSPGPHRQFSKYPISQFPVLLDWIQSRYVEIESEQFLPQGFRLYIRRESPPESTPLPLAEKLQNTQIDLHAAAPAQSGAKVNVIKVGSWMPTGSEIVGMGLTVDGVIQAVTSIEPTDSYRIAVPIQLGPDQTTVTYAPLVQFTDGQWYQGPETTTKIDRLAVTDEQRHEFALPIVSRTLEADGVRALFNPAVVDQPGHREYAMHAPSVLRYTLPTGLRAVSGRYVLPEAAFASTNASPTDGVEIIVQLSTPDGHITELFKKALDPRRDPGALGEHGFRCSLPDSYPADSKIEFIISSGSEGSASSDWTSWVNLTLETSP